MKSAASRTSSRAPPTRRCRTRSTPSPSTSTCSWSATTSTPRCRRTSRSPSRGSARRRSRPRTSCTTWARISITSSDAQAMGRIGEVDHPHLAGRPRHEGAARLARRDPAGRQRAGPALRREVHDQPGDRPRHRPRDRLGRAGQARRPRAVGPAVLRCPPRRRHQGRRASSGPRSATRTRRSPPRSRCSCGPTLCRGPSAPTTRSPSSRRPRSTTGSATASACGGDCSPSSRPATSARRRWSTTTSARTSTSTPRRSQIEVDGELVLPAPADRLPLAQLTRCSDGHDARSTPSCSLMLLADARLPDRRPHPVRRPRAGPARRAATRRDLDGYCRDAARSTVTLTEAATAVVAGHARLAGRPHRRRRARLGGPDPQHLAAGGLADAGTRPTGGWRCGSGRTRAALAELRHGRDAPRGRVVARCWWLRRPGCRPSAAARLVAYDDVAVGPRRAAQALPARPGRRHRAGCWTLAPAIDAVVDRGRRPDRARAASRAVGARSLEAVGRRPRHRQRRLFRA